MFTIHVISKGVEHRRRDQARSKDYGNLWVVSIQFSNIQYVVNF